MTKLFALALAAGFCLPCAASAQTPATNPMPDGSRDMYVGLGVVSKPRYEGAAERERSALPVLQVQLSNGLFVSGMRAGTLLGRSPQVEFGPLLELQPGRDAGGADGEIGGLGDIRFGIAASPLAAPGDKRLAGMPAIHRRMQGGGFLNYYWAWSPSWMLTSSLQATCLLDKVRLSPLVERPTNLTVSTAIAYRF